MTANATQIGGSHYKVPYEHWDFVADLGLGYFEGNATKYLSRWRKKGGIADLQKAKHYVVKLIELVRSGRAGRDPVPVQVQYINRFVLAHELNAQEADAVLAIVDWLTVADLDHAVLLLMALIDQAEERRHNSEPRAPLPEPKPVPLTEENMHADRS